MEDARDTFPGLETVPKDNSVRKETPISFEKIHAFNDRVKEV